MGNKVYFDVEYTDSALDKKRSEEKRAGKPETPRKSSTAAAALSSTHH